jgi:hypothetical protein
VPQLVLGRSNVNFRPFILLVLLAIASWAGPSVAALPLPTLGEDAQCGAYTAKIEERYGVPVHLLDAISVVESGRWDTASKASVAWPWTVSSGGDGKYFPTKAEAIAEMRRLKAAGVRNIDVGCRSI